MAECATLLPPYFLLRDQNHRRDRALNRPGFAGRVPAIGVSVKAWVAIALLSLVAAAPQDSGRHRPTPKPQLHKARTHPPARTPPRQASPQDSSTIMRGNDLGFTAAPMPDPDLTAPPVPENRQPHVTPTLFQLKNAYPGDGYVYGSSPQGMDDRKAATIPGVMLSVPIR